MVERNYIQRKERTSIRTKLLLAFLLLFIGCLMLPENAVFGSAKSRHKHTSSTESTDSTTNTTTTTTDKSFFDDCSTDYGYRQLAHLSDESFAKSVYLAVYEDAKELYNNPTKDVQGVTVDGTTKYYFSTITLKRSITEEDANVIFEAYISMMYDHPLLYFTYPSMSYSGKEVSFYMEADFADGSIRAPLQEKIEQTIINFGKTVVDNTSNYKILKYIHDTICENSTYALTSASDTDTRAYHTIAGYVNDEHKIVCEGYAYTFSAFANYLDLDVMFVTGLVNTNGSIGGHAWNLALLDDGNYYSIDTTWDDGTYYHYNYFCKGREFYSTHLVTNGELDTSYGSYIFTYTLPSSPVSDFEYDLTALNRTYKDDPTYPEVNEYYDADDFTTEITEEETGNDDVVDDSNNDSGNVSDDSNNDSGNVSDDSNNDSGNVSDDSNTDDSNSVEDNSDANTTDDNTNNNIVDPSDNTDNAEVVNPSDNSNVPDNQDVAPGNSDDGNTINNNVDNDANKSASNDAEVYDASTTPQVTNTSSSTNPGTVTTATQTTDTSSDDEDSLDTDEYYEDEDEDDSFTYVNLRKTRVKLTNSRRIYIGKIVGYPSDVSIYYNKLRFKIIRKGKRLYIKANKKKAVNGRYKVRFYSDDSPQTLNVIMKF